MSDKANVFVDGDVLKTSNGVEINNNLFSDSEAEITGKISELYFCRNICSLD